MYTNILIDNNCVLNDQGKNFFFFFSHFKAVSERDKYFLGGLTTARDEVIKCFKSVEVIFNNSVNKLLGNGICKKLVNLVSSRIPVMNLCNAENTAKFLATYGKMRIFFYIRFRNRETQKKRECRGKTES